jgi:hypothetical protein
LRPDRNASAPAGGCCRGLDPAPPSNPLQLLSPQVRSGWLLLELVDHLSPGCIAWGLAHRPPFRRHAGGLPRSLENCTQALAAAQGALGLQLVSIA